MTCFTKADVQIELSGSDRITSALLPEGVTELEWVWARTSPTLSLDNLKSVSPPI
jgi:hypothetical protein